MLSIQVDIGLEVRTLQATDGPSLFALVRANAGMRWFDWWDTLEANQALIEGSLEQYRNQQGFWAGIWVEKELAGLVGLHEVNHWNRTAKLSYWLGRSFQGRGLMTRSCQALLPFAFEGWGLNRIGLTCATANTRSRAVAERLGFAREGTACRAERFNPSVHPFEDFGSEELAEVRPGSGEYFFDHALYGLLYTPEAIHGDGRRGAWREV